MLAMVGLAAWRAFGTYHMVTGKRCSRYNSADGLVKIGGNDPDADPELCLLR